MANEYDLVIVGGGPAGYVAAIRAAQLKLKVAIVEAEKLGGTCLHKGCIPTKALLKSAEQLRNLQHADNFGIEATNFTFNFAKAQQRKNAVIEQLEAGIHSLMKKGKIDVYEGFGRILGPSIFSPLPGTVSVEYSEGNENDLLVPKNLLISTGSKPRELSLLPFNGTTIISSDHIVSMEELPKNIAIIGGGVIGIEWATMLHDMGVDVTIIEAGKHIVPSEDVEISTALAKHLTARGIKIHINTTIDTVAIHEHSVDITVEHSVQSFEKVFVAIGRQAQIKGIGIENTNIQVVHDMIKVNKNGQTKEAHIYAAGDVIGGVQLAHAASNEAIHAVEHMAGLNPGAMNTHIPSCIYSYPEVAHIGLNEAQAKEQFSAITVKKFPFKGNAKALINGEDFGFVKMIVDADTDDVVGVHLIGDQVTELIAESSLAFTVDASAWEIGHTIHPHPSVSEVMQEVALAIHDEAIHY
ncbi:dihydrolipoyl dehydrogenase [Kurthia sibirica]|uniref:Dihydrolipoyl dehydrogenase n=1 Tax=Kurthia sibirica TaxID=202750 RepID=A0A2U3ALT4_9BACL|nr:dihydrolipoyl dehydrogenase [Kurthia sibirica]PWI25495.1 dihydrolipoyl dehydrogenase [Kurthia sibirica]GEK33972.1 dihydrolipoyl dehydrogenase [Kurthia sibirica]